MRVAVQPLIPQTFTIFTTISFLYLPSPGGYLCVWLCLCACVPCARVGVFYVCLRAPDRPVHLRALPAALLPQTPT